MIYKKKQFILVYLSENHRLEDLTLQFDPERKFFPRNSFQVSLIILKGSKKIGSIYDFLANLNRK